MKIYIDGDGCPVVDITVGVGKEKGISCVIVCDECHRIEKQGATTIWVKQGEDSADKKILELIQPGDLLITQDYGLASYGLLKNARIFHQNGWEYTEENINVLLAERDSFRKKRASGEKVSGFSKRTNKENRIFYQALKRALE